MNYKNYILVVLPEYERSIPGVIKDYILSLHIITEVISLSDLAEYYSTNTESNNTLYILTQMVLSTDFFKTTSKNILEATNIAFLNVEMLTEATRMNYIIDIVNYTNFKIIDYSFENIYFLTEYLNSHNIMYYNPIVYFPYQFNLNEHLILKQKDKYEYDVGIINAKPIKSDRVNSNFTYKRTLLYENLDNNTNLKIINIMGWGDERDKIISKCKIILNIHNFECFNIHESIRCDRLVFSKRIIISEPSQYTNLLDTYPNIYFTNYDNLIELSQEIINNFNEYEDKINKLDTTDIIINRRVILKKEIEKLNNKTYSFRYDIINDSITENSTYLEIGIEHGYTFSKIKTSKKIGVDPSSVCISPEIIRKTSDDFFKSNTKTFDVIFIDGMHQVEYVLRDFNNSVNALSVNGVIFLDDIVPINKQEQEKIPLNYYHEDTILKYNNCAWTGDVWKFLLYLISNYSKQIEIQIYKSPNYRGVAKITLLNKIIISESEVPQINKYTYDKDFVNYMKMITLSTAYTCPKMSAEAASSSAPTVTLDCFGEAQHMPRGLPPGPSEGTSEGPSSMKLGAAYNLFDCEELLEASIRSIRPEVDFVVVVYQRVSNFGMQCSSDLMPTLRRLRSEGLVDELLEYAPRVFSPEEKKALVSRRATDAHLGGVSVEDVGDQFMNELTKRELGRQACATRGCNYFMSLDADECYLAPQLRAVKELALAQNYECVACYMRYFFKWPTQEMVPPDDENCVPVLYRIAPHMAFRLACPYPCLVDPTRKLENCDRLHVAERGVIEMHHFSYVRRNIRAKLLNSSSRHNYEGGGAPEHLDQFARSFDAWQPSHGVLHPHPFFKQAFKRTRTVPNVFGIDFPGMGRCAEEESGDCE